MKPTQARIALVVALVTVALSAVVSCVAPQPSVVVAPQAVNYPSAYASRTLAVTTTAKVLTDFGFTASEYATATKAYVTAINAAAYIMFDGTSAGGAITNSHVIASGGRMELTGFGNISRISVVSASATTVTISLER